MTLLTHCSIQFVLNSFPCRLLTPRWSRWTWWGAPSMYNVFKFLHFCVQSVPKAVVYTTFRTLRACKSFVSRCSFFGLCVGSSWRRPHQHNATNHTKFCKEFSIFENGESHPKCNPYMQDMLLFGSQTWYMHS